MDYTKHYHLPQWEKADRIMMEDFNRMCADIEDGLNRNAEAAAGALKTAGAAATPASLRGGLFRAAYNHAAGLLEQNERPWQVGALYQHFNGAAGSALPEGMAQRPDFAWTTNTGEPLCMDSIRDSLRKSSDISYEKDCREMSATFTASASGWITGLRMYGIIRNAAGSKGDCTIRLTNLNTQEAVEQRSSFRLPTITNEGAPRFVKADLYVKSGQRYRVQVIIDDLTSRPEMEFSTESPESLVLVGRQTASVTIPLRVSLEEPAMGGLALVRYRFLGSAGSLRLNWAGAALTPRKIRTVTTRAGLSMQEAEFRRETALSAGSSALEFTVSCPNGSDLQLYAAGVVVI